MEKEYQVNKTDRNTGVDIAKFLLALLILLQHVKPFEDYNFINNVTINYLTRFAVSAFFVISGYNISHYFGKDGIRVDKVKKYILHMLRLYVIWLIIYLPFDVIRIMKGNITKQSLAYIKSVVMSNTIGQLWYLYAMAIAVLIIWAFYKLKMNEYVMLGIATVLYLIGVVGQRYLLLEDGMLKNAFIKYLNIFETFRNGVFFGLVFVLIGIIMHHKSRLRLSCSIAGFVVSYALLGVECVLGGFGKYDMYICLLPVSFFIVQVFLNVKLDEKVARWLSDMSFFVYFTHVWILNVVMKLHFNSIVRFGIVLVGTLLISSMLVRLKKYIRFIM